MYVLKIEYLKDVLYKNDIMKRSYFKMAKKKVNKNEKKSFYRGVLTTISILCFMLAIGFGVYTGLEFYDQVKEQEMVSDIAKNVDGGFIDAIIDPKTGKLITGKNKDGSKSSAKKSVSTDGYSFGNKDDAYRYDGNGTDLNLLRRIDFAKLQAINPDAKKWLYLPGTGIDSYVMQERKVGQFYYLWRNIKHQRNDYGSLFSPKIPGDVEDAHQMIFGHRTYGSYGDVVFAKMPERYKDIQTAERNKYIYVYYPDRAERYVNWTGNNARNSSPVYNIPYQLGTSDYQGLLNHIQSTAKYVRNVKVDKNSKTLVLSTCNSARDSSIRFYSSFVLDTTYYY